MYIDIALDIAWMVKLMAQECMAGQYSYCPNHILGDMNIALALVSFIAYRGSARHFDPPTQSVGFKYVYSIDAVSHHLLFFQSAHPLQPKF
jgi:hypothetical protein